MFGGRRGRVQAQLPQLDPRIVDMAMRLGRDFNLGLQKFAADVARRCKSGGLEQRFRRLGRHLAGFRVRQEIFLFDAELKILVGAKNARRLARRQ